MQPADADAPPGATAIDVGLIAIGIALVAGAGALTLLSPRFGYAFELADMPIRLLTAGLVAAGIAFLPVRWLIGRASTGSAARQRRLLAIIVVTGLAARLALLPSEPALEDDWQRYLWDGGVTARLGNPYALSPEDALRQGDGGWYGRLAGEAGVLMLRINHRDLRTIYPPVAQGAFALAHVVRPWSLASWRAVLLAFDAVVLILVLQLLADVGRSRLWACLYWWNPVLIKEIYNSAHMEVVILPFVLGALLLSVRNRPVLAAASLGFAVGAKVWPALLLPLVLRPLVGRWRELVAAALVFGLLCVLWVAPILGSGLDENSGFVAYVERWKSNSALFPALEQLAARLFDGLGLDADRAGVAVRGLIGLGLGLLALRLARTPVAGTDDLAGRAALLIGALVLVSPAQFPWYSLWLAPLLALRPWWGFLVLTATLPLYYLAFYYNSDARALVFRDVVVWLIWVPAWALLLLEWGAARRRTRP